MSRRPLRRSAGRARCARAGVLLIATLAAACVASPDGAGRFHVEGPDPSAGERDPVAVRGFTPDEWARLSDAPSTEELSALLSVYMDVAGDPPPVLGRHRLDDGALLFEPRFAWSKGLPHRIVFHPSLLGSTSSDGPVERSFTLPAPTLVPSTRVAAVYPSATVLPENVLRFYVHFSGPMSRGEAYERVHVLDAAGCELDQPFLEIQQELWDPSTTRLTLLFDPGRIKQGLVPNLELGAPLREGNEYTFVIDADWADARGAPLCAAFERRFRTVGADHAQPDIDAWTVSAPRAHTRDALSVVLPEPLDHALLERLLRVHADDGSALRGTVAITEEETRWAFTPRDEWKPGRYRLEVDSLLEDLAGNSIDRPFETALDSPSDEPVPVRRVQLAFDVAPVASQR